MYVIHIIYKSISCNVHVRSLQNTKKTMFVSLTWYSYTDKYSLYFVQCLTFTVTVQPIIEIMGTVNYCRITRSRKKHTTMVFLILKNHESVIHLEGFTFDKVVRNSNGTEQFLNFLLSNNCQLEIMRFILSSTICFCFLTIM